uniref:HTH APSES-type domain-containing protein n=1 Tax=Kwoniella dejecticola CBS 10117 TaxID=1296121 RepID=A0A1A6AG95_9TREE|nr:uncharacterized protein I303_00922 [Kwoniella dejecticola CBS 10117]OBR89100.1 hypothetical protein I303_00922 [Kwoniella dejecticola CBS 10117]
MARPIRPAPAPPNGSSSTTSTPSASTPRTSSRQHKPSAAALASASSTQAASTVSTPFTPGPSTPSQAGLSGKGRASSTVEAKAHGLRSIGGAGERTPCPFPAQYGGKEKCGLMEEDEADEVLMGILASIAYYDNRALSVEEIASTCFQQGWLRPPSAAIEPTTPINNSIRSYLKRCERNRRHCLLAKHQLAGSVVEQVLQPALHPNAFDDTVRPKGTVWFLLGGTGKSKWKSPFEGIEVPKMPPRKPAPKKIQPQKENRVVKSEEKKVGTVQKGKAKVPAPVKIRLVLNGPAAGEEEPTSETESSLRSRSASVSQEPVGLGLAQPISLPQMKSSRKSKPRRPRDILDSSSDSDTSDSEMEFDIPGPSRLIRRTTSLRKVPPPLALGGSPRVHSSSRLPQHSPFMDIFYPSPIIPSSPFQPHASPFPSHSLDNTTWVARHDPFYSQFETSSSSSDDEMRETTWGMDSEILVKAVDGNEDAHPSWSMDEDETKVKEATDALRVLFPLSSPDDDAVLDSKLRLNQLDNRPSLFESPGSNAAAMHNQLKADDAGGISLNTWIANSSPQASPNLRTYKNLAPPIDVSPTQHLSKLRSSFDPEEMEVDDETPWLDESGELPVKAEDTFSDVDLNSTIGDAPTPEHDRHLHTALWAQEAAAIRIKQEPEDYPSPLTTEPDDQSAADYRGSRASSTPSSGSSELPPFEIECDNGRMGVDDVILGPESVTVEELDGWLPAQLKADKTPHRGRASKNRNHPLRCSGNWGGIGVCSALANIVKPAVRNRSVKSNATARRRKSSPPPQVIDISSRLTPDTDMEGEVDDAIGTADLEQAKIEADAREEQHRKACKEKAEQQKAMMEAIRESVRSEQRDHQHQKQDAMSTPWSESNNAPWGTASTDSLQIVTPGALSPMALFGMSNLNLGTPINGCMAVDPKALVSPPLQPAFGFPSMPTPPQSLDMGSQNLGSAFSQKEGKKSVKLKPSPTSAAPKASVHGPSTASTPNTKAASRLQAIAPAPPRALTPSPTPAPAAVQVPVQPTAITVTSASAPNEKSTAIVALPTRLPPANVSSKTTPSPASATSSTKATVIPTSSATSGAATPAATGSMPPPANGNGNGNSNGKSGAKLATITKALCPGVDACVVDNIPVYAHVFEGKAGQGRQVLLRRLDTDFVNANALLAALGVPESKYAEYFDHPISPVRMAARHIIPTSDADGEFSPGVSGIWVHLSEAKDFARRAKLKENSLLASLLRGDLFQLFAALAGIKPDHPPSEVFGLPFLTRPPPRAAANTSNANSNSNTNPTPNTSAGSGLSSVNSKSAPNLTELSTSTSMSSSTPANQQQLSRQGQASTGLNTPTTMTGCTTKGPLVRSAPPTPPDGCPGPKRRRATISSPLAKKPGVQPLTTTAPSTPTSASTPSVVNYKAQPNFHTSSSATPAAGTRMSVAAQKRATRASISGAVPKPSVK